MKVSYRPAGESDNKFLWNLARVCYRETAIAQFGEWNEAFQRDHFEEKWPSQTFRIVLQDDESIGAIWTEHEPDHIHLREVLVLPAFQNRGIGTLLVQQVIETARAEGKPIHLTVLKANRARHLYERLGFRRQDAPELGPHCYLMRYDVGR